MPTPERIQIVVPIPDLVTATTVNDTDYIPLSQEGVTKKVEVQTLLASAGSNFLPGMIMAYGAASTPTGWLRCDWSSYDPTVYPDLFAVIGYTWGNNAGNFRVPDCRGRSLMGDGTGVTHPGLSPLTARTVGDMPGDETGSQAHSHTITVANASLTVTITVDPIAYNLTPAGTIAVASFTPLGSVSVAAFTPLGSITINPYVGNITPLGTITLNPHDHDVTTIAVSVAEAAGTNVAQHNTYTTTSETVTGTFTGSNTAIDHTHTGSFTGASTSTTATFTGSSTSTTATFTGTPLSGNLSTTATGTIPNHNHTASSSSVTVTIPIIQPNAVVRYIIKT